MSEPTADTAAVPFSSLLYRRPHLYDLVFPDADDATGRMVRAAIARYLAAMPRSMLDVGCGTGLLLARLADIPERYGVDLLESNVAYARSVRPGVRFHRTDMRTVRLGRTFELLTCLGNALSYALDDQDLADALSTFATHTQAGALLVLDPLNARAYLEGDGFRERVEGRVDAPEFSASSLAVHRLDRRRRILTRTRTWHIAGEADVHDYAEYRLLFPEEVTSLLRTAGFEVLAMYDNRELAPTDLAGRAAAAPDVGGMRGRKLYVFARRR